MTITVHIRNGETDPRRQIEVSEIETVCGADQIGRVTAIPAGEEMTFHLHGGNSLMLSEETET